MRWNGHLHQEFPFAREFLQEQQCRFLSVQRVPVIRRICFLYLPVYGQQSTDRPVQWNGPGIHIKCGQ